MARWGIPWYRINPARRRWDWSWLDRVAARFAELGVTPIIDLMHYGTPLWLEGQFAHPDYPHLVADYASRVAERYRDTFTIFTPLNEPLLTVLYCGEFGYWPPYLTGDQGLVQMLSAIARGIVLTQQAATAASPAASFLHVEASFRFDGHLADPTRERHLRDRAWLVQDLLTGHIDEAHPLTPYLSAHGMPDAALDWHLSNIAEPDVMGVNYYPAHSTEVLQDLPEHSGGPLDPRPRINDWTAGLADVLTLFAERYHRPVFLTETCYTGSVADRMSWLEDSVECVHQLRADGVPVIGYTWWSLFDMFEWTYRPGRAPVGDYQLSMGLWDLVPDEAGVLHRRRNSVADRFQHHAAAAVTA